MEKTDHIRKTIQEVDFDFKAEAVIADLLENGLDWDGFAVIPSGVFRRRYSRDIGSTSRIKLNNGTELLGIHVHRDAVYDKLPEGFFHQNTDNPGDSGKESRNSRKLKEEEKAARNFFLPLENEIFSRRIDLELEERKILKRFSENLPEDFSSEFWKLRPSASHDKLLSGMVSFLHIAYKIAGNSILTARCLEAIINEPVTVTTCKNNAAQKTRETEGWSKQHCPLGTAILGVDFICGDEFMSMGQTMNFSIGPLKNSSITDYLENGRMLNFLKIFFGYFVPVESEVAIHLSVSPEKLDFNLQTSGKGAVLGYETAI